MSWISDLKNFVATMTGTKKKTSGKARRWDAARTDRLNTAHWSRANGVPINADLASWLSELRTRTEHEVANNSLVEGMVQTYQLCVVGSEGPQLSVLTDDETYQVARARVWADWSLSAGSNQQLSMVEILDGWIRSCFGGGEFVTQMVTVPQLDSPIKMRLLPIHTHRLATPPQYVNVPDVALGVRRDLKNRRPLSYFIQQPLIYGAWELYNAQFDEIQYSDLLHGFRMTEEDQVRGVPWLASCLESVAALRDFKIETLDAARAAADFAILLSTSHPDAPYIQTNDSTTIERRTIRNLPPGWEASQMAPAHPGPQYESFYESLAREIGGPICMPLMMLLLDSSSHNYSSARFDGQMFWRGVAKTQGWLGRFLSRIENIVAIEAELAGILPSPPEDMQRRWVWPKAPHVDPEKEANAERASLENGTLSYTEACAAHNKDAATMIRQRQRDNEMLEAAGLPPIPGIAGSGFQPSGTEELPQRNTGAKDAARKPE